MSFKVFIILFKLLKSCSEHIKRLFNNKNNFIPFNINNYLFKNKNINILLFIKLKLVFTDLKSLF